MTDQEIDAIIDQQKPHLRVAYRQMFEKGQPWVGVPIGQQKLPNGATWQVMMIWASEPVAALIQGTLTGYMGLMQSMAKMAGQPPAPGAPSTPAPSTTNAFGIPVG